MPIEFSNIGEGTIIRHPELVNIYGATIGENCKIAAFVEIGGAKIGNRVSVQAFSFICPNVIIGDDVFIGPRVTFLNDKYPPSHKVWLSEQPIRVWPKASIGAGAVILPGVQIGEAALIAAGAIVTKDVLPGVICFR